MSVVERRSSFVIHFLDSDPQPMQGFAHIAKGAGFVTLSFTDLDELKNEAAARPPHFVVVRLDDPVHLPVKTLSDLRLLLPETLFFLTASNVQFAQPKVAGILEKFIYDILPLPMVNPALVVKAFDRAAELDYQIYLNEHLREELRAQEPQRPAVPEPLSTYFFKLEKAGQIDEAAQIFMDYAARSGIQAPMAFLRYFASRRALSVRHVTGMPAHNFAELGIDLNREQQGQDADAFFKSAGYGPLEELAASIFGWHRVSREVLIVDGEPVGVFLLENEGLGFAGNANVHAAFTALRAHLKMLDLESQCHAHLPVDRDTGLMNAKVFYAQTVSEVARSRRIEQPVCALVLKLDGAKELRRTLGGTDWAQLVRLLGKLIVRHSRTNDVVARIDEERLAMLLPHTPLSGARLKAQRLVQLIAATNFGKFIKGAEALSISVGVSEHPNFCDDADELLASADQALLKAMDAGGNRLEAPPPRPRSNHPVALDL